MIIKSPKGCRDIYHILAKSKIETPTSQSKWSDQGIYIANQKWSNIYLLPFKTTQNTTIQWFQFKILHRIIETSPYLTYKTIFLDKTCNQCKNIEESIEHMFYYCPKVQTLWNDLQTWILNI